MIGKVSLLYKNAGKRLYVKGEMPQFLKDLQFDGILNVMCENCRDKDGKRIIASVFAELCENPEDIDYRYDILQDFLKAPRLVMDMEQLFGRMGPVERDRQASIRAKNKVSAEYKLAKAIGLFFEYCGLYKKLAAVLSSHNEYRSDGLKRLSSTVCGCAGSGDLKELEKLLRELKLCLKGYMRLKLEVQTDTSFKLTEAVVCDMNSNGFGVDCLDKPEFNLGSLAYGLKRLFKSGNRPDEAYIIKNTDYILEQNVNEIKDKALFNIASILEVMSSSISSFLNMLAEEIVFYKGASRLVKAVQKLKLPYARAVFAPEDKRILKAEGLYDLSFALYLADNGSPRPIEVIVPNEALFGDTGRIQVITGPNQGGKTTYIRAIGIFQVLAQAGIPVPAVKAEVSPVDCIFTHFPGDEKPESTEGRLGEELARLRLIIESATDKSLILLNESLATTNSKEGSLIAGDILAAFSIMKVRCAFVTHLYELAERVEMINEKLEKQSEGFSRLISMTAQYDEASVDSDSEACSNIRKRTYRILPGTPAKSSFAADIAEQYGIR